MKFFTSDIGGFVQKLMKSTKIAVMTVKRDQVVKKDIPISMLFITILTKRWGSWDCTGHEDSLLNGGCES